MSNRFLLFEDGFLSDQQDSVAFVIQFILDKPTLWRHFIDTYAKEPSMRSSTGILSYLGEAYPVLQGYPVYQLYRNNELQFSTSFSEIADGWLSLDDTYVVFNGDKYNTLWAFRRNCSPDKGQEE